MKFLNCTKCHDIIRATEQSRSCYCRSSTIIRLGSVVEVSGPCRVIRCNDRDYARSINFSMDIQFESIKEPSKSINRKLAKDKSTAQ